MATPPDFVAGAVLQAAQLNQIGLWLVTGASFSAVSAVNVNNCFTSDYDDYLVNIKITAWSTAQAATLRMRASGSDNTQSEYYFSGIAAAQGSDTTLYFPRSNAANAITITRSTGNVPINIVLNINDPAQARVTTMSGEYIGFSLLGYNIGGGHNVASAFDGFSLIAASAQTLTGSYRVYGKRD